MACGQILPTSWEPLGDTALMTRNRAKFLSLLARWSPQQVYHGVEKG
jgi:hypothetical protein